MAKGRKNASRKRRTREHVIADLAVNHVERYVLRSGHVMQRVIHDYGLDAAITTFNHRGEVENGLVWMQIKATDHPRRMAARVALAVRVERKHLLFWMGERYPVILVLYAASEDVAYWFDVQTELRDSSKLFGLPRFGTSLTIHIPLAQVLDETAIATFRRRKAIVN